MITAFLSTRIYQALEDDMSMQIQFPMDCPKCGKRQEIPIWKSINSSSDPELKQALFQGQINQFRCFKCGYEGHIDIDFIYHDMKRKFLVAYHPFYFLEQEDLLKTFTPNGELISDYDTTPDGKTNSEADDNYFFRPMHFVFSMQELLNYIAFRDTLFEAQNPGLLSDTIKIQRPEPKPKESNPSKKWWQRGK